MRRIEFVALSSSRGTTLQAMLERIADGSLPATCRGLVTDDITRGCREKAELHGLPVSVVPREKGRDRESYDRRLDEAIRAMTADARTALVACVGWMRILSPWFVTQWRNRILNVHPSLLPAHPGAHAIQEALAAGETESGMTIHLVDEGVDTGPVLLQSRCPVLPEDTEDTLKARIQALEQEGYPAVLRGIADGTIVLPG